MRPKDVSQHRHSDFALAVKFFPHEAADLEPVCELLQRHTDTNTTAWEVRGLVSFRLVSFPRLTRVCVCVQVRYILLTWLSMIVMVPFDLGTIDSSLEVWSVMHINTARSSTRFIHYSFI